MSRKPTPKILLMGGSGQIGSHFLKILKNKYQIISPSHRDLDVTDKKSVESLITKLMPDQIVYSIGFTSIDQAPSRVYEAFQLNEFGVYNTTGIASRKKIPLHYLSTEVVFNGSKKNSPYTENDRPDPQSLNAHLKRTGELITLDASAANSVIRLIICYSASFKNKTDIARSLVKNLSEGKTFNATTDQEINPIYVTHLVKAISIILDNQAGGIYHIGAKDYTTPFNFCQMIAKKLKLDHKLVKGLSFKQFSQARPEPRPQHEWLDVNKFLKDFGQESLFTIEEGIEEFAKDYLKSIS